MSEFSASPSQAELLRSTLHGIQDSIFTFTEHVYGIEGIASELDKYQAGLSDEEAEALSNELDARIKAQDAKSDEKTKAEWRQSPQEFQAELWYKVKTAFGQIDGYQLDTDPFFPNSEEILITRFDEHAASQIDLTPFAGQGMRLPIVHRRKHIICDGNTVVVKNDLHSYVSGRARDTLRVVELPPEEDDASLPHQTLERLGIAQSVLDNLQQAFIENGDKLPDDFYSFDDPFEDLQYRILIERARMKDNDQ